MSSCKNASSELDDTYRQNNVYERHKAVKWILLNEPCVCECVGVSVCVCVCGMQRPRNLVDNLLLGSYKFGYFLSVRPVLMYIMQFKQPLSCLVLSLFPLSCCKCDLISCTDQS